MIISKNKYLFVCVLGIALALSSFIVIRSKPKELHRNFRVTIPQEYVVSQYQEDNFSLLTKSSKSFVGFKEKMGYRESRCNYFLVNNYGYMGKYQFGKTALKFYGVENQEEFLNTPELQEKLFEISISYNKWNLRKEIKKYSGKYISGVLVTESGILAAAHLAGASSVRRFLSSKGSFNFADANGTSVRNYLKSFQGYDLSHIQANKSARTTIFL